ncbi:MAG: DUF2231 domain-containing protein [Acidobacteriota bacterium]
MSGRSLRVLGHPVHPMLTAFPVALWSASLLWDVVGLVRPETLWSQMAFWTLALGLIAFVPTATTGFVDFLRLTPGDQVESLASRHMMASFGAASFFTVSLVVRRFEDPSSEFGLSLLLSAVGWIVLMAAGWLGGELVFGHGVAVERLTDEPSDARSLPAEPPVTSPNDTESTA